jgi:CheY-like chemotaxis protein
MTTTNKNEPLRPDVLIVEDDENSRLYLKAVLAKAKVSSIDALDGVKALELIERNRPRIIVSDIRMPRMNGYELLHKVRKSKENYSNTPFILLTGLADGELADAAAKIGVNAFFGKPLDAEQFCDTIRGLLAAPPEAKQKAVAEKAAGTAKSTEPKQLESMDRLHEIFAKDGANPQTFGHVICLGTEEIQRRVGDAHWQKLKANVSKLMNEAVAAVCRAEDVYIGCDDGSVIIVFGDNDVVHAEACAARAAKQVSEALFGSDELNSVKVTSIVQTADGYVTEGRKNVSDVIDSLMKFAHKHAVQAKPEANAPAAPVAAPSSAQKSAENGDDKAAIPSFRDALMSQLETGKDQPISFKFLPVWDIQNRVVNTFMCIPSRQNSIGHKARWGYQTLGQSPSLSEIVELDIACLEFGLLEVITLLSSGKQAYLTLSIHFESLAHKNSREKLLGLLREIPENLRSLVRPILTNAPDGVPEMRLREITGELQSLTDMMAVEVFLAKEGKDVMRTVSRMHGAGIKCILTNVRSDMETQEIQIAQKIGERVRQLGGLCGVTGIRNFGALMDIAYSPLDFCTGKALGGPYERPPAPFSFDAKSLERRKSPRGPSPGGVDRRRH